MWSSVVNVTENLFAAPSSSAETAPGPSQRNLIDTAVSGQSNEAPRGPWATRPSYRTNGSSLATSMIVRGRFLRNYTETVGM